MNNYRDNPKTDESCAFIEPSKINKQLYPHGEEIETIHNIPQKYRIKKNTFEMISDEKKEEQAKQMLEAGNTASPLYYLLTKRFPDLNQQNDDINLPDWVLEFVFKE